MGTESEQLLTQAPSTALRTQAPHSVGVRYIGGVAKISSGFHYRLSTGLAAPAVHRAQLQQQQPIGLSLCPGFRILRTLQCLCVCPFLRASDNLSASARCHVSRGFASARLSEELSVHSKIALLIGGCSEAVDTPRRRQAKRQPVHIIELVDQSGKCAALKEAATASLHLAPGRGLSFSVSLCQREQRPYAMQPVSIASELSVAAALNASLSFLVLCRGAGTDTEEHKQTDTRKQTCRKRLIPHKETRKAATRQRQKGAKGTSPPPLLSGLYTS